MWIRPIQVFQNASNKQDVFSKYYLQIDKMQQLHQRNQLPAPTTRMLSHPLKAGLRHRMTHVHVWETIQSWRLGHVCLSHVALLRHIFLASCFDGCWYNYSCNQIRVDPFDPKQTGACLWGGAETLHPNISAGDGLVLNSVQKGSHTLFNF